MHYSQEFCIIRAMSFTDNNYLIVWAIETLRLTKIPFPKNLLFYLCCSNQWL